MPQLATVNGKTIKEFICHRNNNIKQIMSEIKLKGVMNK